MGSKKGQRANLDNGGELVQHLRDVASNLRHAHVSKVATGQIVLTNIKRVQRPPETPFFW